ncbi:unnamed protein product [Vicia faba]|uniref:Pentatricopeptide repeat-containing protein n=1 Tax=Vicia faba TaxID=3906 RepID=A0AAV0YMM1_VICFA|nr:unnamed protein product [Vicia faba]
MLFRVCSDNRLFPEAVRVFDYVEEKGFVIEERSCFVLLLALKRCGEIELCLRFFRRMVESNGIEIRVQSLTLVIDGLCKRGEVEKAKELMDEMVTKSIVKPTVFTYNTLLNAYVGRKDRSGVGEILRLMEKEPVVFSVATYSILIQWYSSSGDIGEVEKIFEEMRERKIEINVYVYSSMISWNCRLGNMKRAFALFDEMAQRNVAPNAHTYGALIGGVCKAGQMEAAEILLEEMQSKGIDLNMIIFNTMIDGYCKRGMMDEALRLQTIMERKGFNADVFTFNILANGLCKLHRYDEAKCTLNSMVEKGVEPNVVTFTMFIEIYCKEGNLAEAERFFRDMEKKGEVPNIVTYNTLIDVYCKKEKVKLAHLTKSKMINKGLLPDVYTYTSLIHGECIVGRVDEALKIFDEMRSKGITGNVATYTSLISGLSKEGRADEAFKLYDEMIKMGLIPDDRVFSALVGSLHKPLTHAGLKQNEYEDLKVHITEAILLVAMATSEDMRINAEHIRIADQFVEVPGGTNNNNYANVQLILEIAEITHVDAVWPGWGHASENPELPDALKAKGIVTSYYTKLSKEQIIEEGPITVAPPETVKELEQAARRLAISVNYVGAATASDYRDNKIHTGWLDSRIAMRVRAERPPWYLSVVGGALYKATASSAALVSDYVGYLEKGQIPPKHISLVRSQVSLSIEGSKYTIDMIRGGPGSYKLKLNQSEIEAEIHTLRDGGLLMQLDGNSHVIYAEEEAAGTRLLIDGRTCLLQNDHDPSKLIGETPCKLLRYLVADDSHIDADTPYAEVEVMKMCMPLLSPASGIIHFRMAEGQAMQFGC